MSSNILKGYDSFFFNTVYVYIYLSHLLQITVKPNRLKLYTIYFSHINRKKHNKNDNS